LQQPEHSTFDVRQLCTEDSAPHCAVDALAFELGRVAKTGADLADAFRKTLEF